MAVNKTKATEQSVETFLGKVENEQKREDCFTLVKLMEEVTGAEAKMWGDAIVGFDQYHYKYDSGREGDFMLIGFSPRKDNLTLYIVAGFDEYGPLLSKLGKHKTGKSCLYVKSLKDIDLATLKEMAVRSVAHMRQTHQG
jgi:hypothetical protein